MKMIDKKDVAAVPASVVAIGSFDGVHLGHRKLLNTLRDLGESAGLDTALVTFDPIPRMFISPESAPRLICSIDTRLKLLAETGAIDHCHLIHFNEDVRQLSVDDFIRQHLIDRLGMRALVVGENFACGRGRTGDVAYLRELGSRLGFSVITQPLLTPKGMGRCSSTETRRLIQCGEMAEAARMLNRAHEVPGVVFGESSFRRSRNLQVAIDKHLCTPPNDNYEGAIRVVDRPYEWEMTKLTVSGQSAQGQTMVNLTVRGEFPARIGDNLAMRFSQRAA